MNQKKVFDCYFHKGCVDGAASAALIMQFLKNDVVNFHPIDYSFNDFSSLVGKNCIFVDIAPRIEGMMGVIGNIKSLLVLDHHKTQMLEWRPYLPVIHRNDNHTVRFDLDESAASLTWRYFRNSLDLPRLVTYVKDYDLYKFDLHFTKEIQAYLESLVMGSTKDKVRDMLIVLNSAILEFELKDSVNFNVIKSTGFTILSHNKSIAISIATENAKSFVGSAGECIAVVPSPRYLRNYVADELLFRHDFVFVYEDLLIGDKNVRKWSMRAAKGRSLQHLYNEIPGAGGHPNSGGFFSEITNDPVAEVAAIFTRNKRIL